MALRQAQGRWTDDFVLSAAQPRIEGRRDYFTAKSAKDAEGCRFASLQVRKLYQIRIITWELSC
ncbi:hypothetical protein SE17_42450 [Kouleothrix aurantiaca]|uniref:Uncharacterized protein n=1 Tax=Kouleothrix aurantiaca TaxID=186479 RepID=A0A0P9H062_9CHLR|nr:hypothetical protein SE17_42450 [Kouleothrix aurantiaca]